MARVAILGAGVSGHTAALHLRRRLSKEHDVVVISPNRLWNWIPSNIWVGVGKMTKKQVVFKLAPIYRRAGIEFHQALATAIWPEGDSDSEQGAVDITYTSDGRKGQTTRLRYDYLINATGPKLNFDATPGLGPDSGHSLSVCTADHAEHTAKELEKCIERMHSGEKLTFVIGTGHGKCTCEGAAFEYVFNVDHSLRKADVRDKANVVFLTNEAKLGDFGVDGITLHQSGFETNGDLWTRSLFREREVQAIVGAHVHEVTEDTIRYEQLDGSEHSMKYDFAMLLPPFTGVGLKAYAADGTDMTNQLFAPNKFMKVDADYTNKPYEEWDANDWPETYQCPGYDNVFAVGIAFAPPHAISKPRETPNGVHISPAPPRTGMPSGVMGKAVAMTIADRIEKGADVPAHRASMARMGAACVASAGTGLLDGSAASMTMLPVVPDYDRYPTGRDVRETRGEIGLAGHWLKLMLHYLFIYKAKARPGWQFIPE